METIYSLVTKPINQNIAVIRISGPDAFCFLNLILKTKITPEANKVVYSKFFNNDEFIDEGLILMFKAPNSFTGENVVEVQTHGSMYVVEKILEIFRKSKIGRVALPGEFSKQAFLNKKMDLTKASAINSLILSENKQVARKSSLNINGKQLNYVNHLIKVLENLIARLQVSIDYPENNDIEEYSSKSIHKDLKVLKEDISWLIKKSKQLQKVNDGFSVVIIGEPNVGKSTLVNEILGEERVIVSDIKGTTRDVIEVRININDVNITLKDTAGLRNRTNDKLEAIGIEKTKEEIKKSDLVLYLQTIDNISSSLPSYLEDSKDKTINILTKSDLIPDHKKNNNYVYISSINGEIDQLLTAIEDGLKNFIPNQMEKDFEYLTDKTQISLYEEILENIEGTLELLVQNYPIDLILSEVENSLEILYRIIGKKMNPDYINNLFGGFCLGK